MAFCKFSSQTVISEKTSVDNLFINEFLPNASGDAVKVYLYGLYKCSNADSLDNTLESFARVLNLTEKQIEEIFLYWQEQGLVQVLPTEPIEVRYLPIKNLFSNIKKYKPEKYQAFNIQVQELISGRMISPNEYAEYYDLIERLHFEPEALLMLVQYCVNLKGNNIGYNYIITIARNWASENVLTAEAVEEKLASLEHIGTALGELLKTLSIKRKPSIEERELYKKWNNEYCFEEDVIIFVAKQMKKKKLSVSFEKLDSKLTKYYEMGFTSIKEISAYETTRQEMFNCAFEVNKTLGIYYENNEVVVENYIAHWFQMGYTHEALVQIAKFCFQKSIRTLQGMHNIVLKLYKLGVVSSESIFEYMEHLSQSDIIIKRILEQLGLSRNVNQWDRNYYSTWKDNWKINDELFQYGISLAKDKIQPMQYLNKIFSIFFENNITTVEQAKSLTLPTSQTAQTIETKKGRSYSQKELNALFDSIEEIEV